MKTLAALIVPLLLAGCAAKKPSVVQVPVPEPRVVTVTDTSPSSAVVERSVARVEAKVAETSSKVDEVAESVSGAVESAIRANDEQRLAEMRKIREQVDELRIGLKLADAASKALNEEVQALKETVEKVSAERDAARKAEAQALIKHDADKMKWETEKGLLKGEKAVVSGQLEEVRAAKDKWVRAAFITWGVVILSGLAYALIRWKIL